MDPKTLRNRATAALTTKLLIIYFVLATLAAPAASLRDEYLTATEKTSLANATPGLREALAQSLTTADGVDAMAPYQLPDCNQKYLGKPLPPMTFFAIRRVCDGADLKAMVARHQAMVATYTRDATNQVRFGSFLAVAEPELARQEATFAEWRRELAHCPGRNETDITHCLNGHYALAKTLPTVNENTALIVFAINESMACPSAVAFAQKLAEHVKFLNEVTSEVTIQIMAGSSTVW